MPLTAARRALLESMGHDELVDAITEHAVHHTWLAFAPRTTKQANGAHLTAYHHQSGKGFPDICLAGLGWILFVEVKTGSGRLEREQRVWRDVILAAEEHNEASRVLHVVVRPTGLPQLQRFLETGLRQHLVTAT